MADERKIVIELKATNTTTTTDPTRKNEEFSLSDYSKTSKNPTKSMQSATLGKTVLLLEAYQYAKSFLKNHVSFSIEKNFNLTENYKAEQDLQNTMSALQHTASIGSMIAGSAMLGFEVGGPWGAVAGAAIGTGAATINTLFDAYKSWNLQNRSLTTMNIQASFQQVRLGLIDDGRGTMN